MDQFDSLDAVLILIKRMEATVLGLQQLRSEGAGQEIVAELIKEAESKLAEVKCRIIQ